MNARTAVSTSARQDRRVPRWPWLALAPLMLMGCGRGPSAQEVCEAIVLAVPVSFVHILAVLWFLEALRNAPDRGVGSLGGRALGTGGVLIALSALAWALGARAQADNILVMLIGLFAAVTSAVSLIVWRVRARAPYASRVLRAAQVGAGLGLPALVLWAPGLEAITEVYIQGLALAAFGSMFVTTPLMIGLIIECLIRRGADARRRDGLRSSDWTVGTPD